MRMKFVVFLCASWSVTFFLAVPALGQERSVEDVRLIQRLRADVARDPYDGTPGRIIEGVLRQVTTKRSVQELDMLADSLVDLAVRRIPGSVSQQDPARGQAVSALARSALPSGDGVPYRGAIPRLQRIVEESAYSPMRARALGGVTRVLDRPAALVYLRKVATMNHQVAWTAIRLLHTEFAPDGLAVMRALYREGSVVQDDARIELNAQAKFYKW